MRLNQFLAKYTDLSRRKADQAIAEGRVEINGQLAGLGDIVSETDNIKLDKQIIQTSDNTITLILNKPVGYVCSRDGQGSKTIYDILPVEYHRLNSVGRLDKDSSGLLLLTNDGELANQLTHPRYSKIKRYEIKLDKPLQPLHHQMINDHGIKIEDYVSRLQLSNLDDSKQFWEVIMSQGRNRQIRRTFEALGYNVTELHRTNFGNYALNNLAPGKTLIVG